MKVRKFQRLIWQQDGEPGHTANPVMDYLDGIFGDRMLALKEWAPHSPDLNPCDFICGDISNLLFTSLCFQT